LETDSISKLFLLLFCVSSVVRLALCPSLFALRPSLSHNALTLSSLKSSGGKMADTAIRPKPNGPYLIEGPVDIYDTAGNKIETEGRPKIALCRCGASSNKPFCDGTHSKIGFQAAETINPESAETQP
jgi:CDGSH-type Zn-finger protein